MLSMVSNVEFLGLGDTYHPGLWSLEKAFLMHAADSAIVLKYHRAIVRSIPWDGLHKWSHVLTSLYLTSGAIKTQGYIFLKETCIPKQGKWVLGTVVLARCHTHTWTRAGWHEKGKEWKPHISHSSLVNTFANVFLLTSKTSQFSFLVLKQVWMPAPLSAKRKLAESGAESFQQIVFTTLSSTLYINLFLFTPISLIHLTKSSAAFYGPCFCFVQKLFYLRCSF